MRYSLKAGAIEKVSTDCVVVAVYSKGTLSEEATALDKACGKIISKLVKSGDFSGKLGETQLLSGPTGIPAKRILLVGVGPKNKLASKQGLKVLNAACKALMQLKATSAHIALASLEIETTDRIFCVVPPRPTLPAAPRITSSRSAPFVVWPRFKFPGHALHDKGLMYKNVKASVHRLAASNKERPWPWP